MLLGNGLFSYTIWAFILIHARSESFSKHCLLLSLQFEGVQNTVAHVAWNTLQSKIYFLLTLSELDTFVFEQSYVNNPVFDCNQGWRCCSWGSWCNVLPERWRYQPRELVLELPNCEFSTFLVASSSHFACCYSDQPLLAFSVFPITASVVRLGRPVGKKEDLFAAEQHCSLDTWEPPGAERFQWLKIIHFNSFFGWRCLAAGRNPILWDLCLFHNVASCIPRLVQIS